MFRKLDLPGARNALAGVCDASKEIKIQNG
jgi:hypothetical protein